MHSVVTSKNKKDGYRQRNVKVWVSAISLRHILASLGYAAEKITVNVTWMKRGFGACQTHRSMYPSIFNRFPVIQPVSSKVPENNAVGRRPLRCAVELLPQDKIASVFVSRFRWGLQRFLRKKITFQRMNSFQNCRLVALRSSSSSSSSSKLALPRIWLLKTKFTSFETSNKFNIVHYVLLFSCLYYPSSSDIGCQVAIPYRIHLARKRFPLSTCC